MPYAFQTSVAHATFSRVYSSRGKTSGMPSESAGKRASYWFANRARCASASARRGVPPNRIRVAAGDHDRGVETGAGVPGNDAPSRASVSASVRRGGSDRTSGAQGERSPSARSNTSHSAANASSPRAAKVRYASPRGPGSSSATWTVQSALEGTRRQSAPAGMSAAAAAPRP